MQKLNTKNKTELIKENENMKVLHSFSFNERDAVNRDWPVPGSQQPGVKSKAPALYLRIGKHKAQLRNTVWISQRSGPLSKQVKRRADLWELRETCEQGIGTVLLAGLWQEDETIQLVLNNDRRSEEEEYLGYDRARPCLLYHWWSRRKEKVNRSHSSLLSNRRPWRLTRPHGQPYRIRQRIVVLASWDMQTPHSTQQPTRGFRDIQLLTEALDPRLRAQLNATVLVDHAWGPGFDPQHWKTNKKSLIVHVAHALLSNLLISGTNQNKSSTTAITREEFVV